MVSYIRSDLDFILSQIKLSEAHAAGQPLYGPGGLIPSYNIAWGLRTVDGSYNHLLPGQEQWGAADNQFPQLLDPVYRPADGTPFDPDGGGPGPELPTAPNYNPSNNPNSLVFDSSLRTISNLLVDQTLGNPAAILTALERAGNPNPMATLPAVTAIYATFKPAFDAEYQARVVMQNAQTAVNDALLGADNDPNTPLSPAEQAVLDAANAALVVATDAHTAAVATLDAARVVRDAALEPLGIAMDGDNVHLPNIAPDEGLSAPFNSWFTLFGQFFDHGLDLVNKGGSGTVFIPLQPDDPLYVEGSHTNFMVLTRATVSAGNDGIMGTADDVRPVNTTTSFVDQNQTYTSHPSHQVFLRQYELDANDVPHATGRLIEGANGGMATWGEVKAQARMLGIELTDNDVGSVPLLRTDQYGNFIPDAAGYAQIIIGIGVDGIPNTADDVVVSGTFDTPINPTTAGAIRTSHAFLADIAHDAVPLGKIADGDITIGLANPGNGATEYDNELLDAHFIAGDGRANENVGLTAVHHVFHAEHNRLVQHTKDVTIADAAAMLAAGATQAEAVAFLNEWLATDVAAVPVGQAAIDALNWDGERLFQAAKFGTEMQYQHLVFEEFARKIQPAINVFLVPDGFDTTLDPSIVAEFAHVVYRFGHSMLTESIDQFDPTFTANHISLIEGFLNPTAFNGVGGTIDDGIAAGAIVRGMTRQVGNEIDEFVTSALRNNLLGLPLDLATINLARGRDTGVPSLNTARAQFYEASNQNILLKPYESWVDFAGHLKNEASIINFVAAYGTHSLITSQTTVEGKRDAALTIITGVSYGGLEVPEDAVDFLNASGAYAGGSLGGLNNVDLWIGGLAEEIMPFGGMLGSTFNFVFEVQMENLQSGDRFYYLQRLDGLHLFGEMENNSFAAMIMRNTNATHLPSDVFSVPGFILEVDRINRQFNDVDGDGDLENTDPTGTSLLTPLVIRNNPATSGPDTNYLRYTGGDHVVLGGTDPGNAFNPSGNDILIGGIGDDTLYGDGGNDRLDGGFGNDIINGGDGDDIIVDAGGDDNIKGGAGNDVIHAGPGLDLVLAGPGKDFVFLGTDMGSEVFAGEGDDFIYGNKNAERILGNEGSDWIETGTFDGAPGDNFDEIFAQDGIDGHDVFLGDGGFDEFIGEGGDDIMVGSAGRGKVVGMSGYDWITYKDNTFGVDADLSIPIVFDESPTLPQNASLDEFEAVEGLSGTRFDDILHGTHEDATTLLPISQGGSGGGNRGSELDADGIARIAGLQAVLGTGVTSFAAGDIILGGDGDDRITGGGGDDIIDGDKWLNVRISVRSAANHNVEIASHNSMTTLASAMFAGTINPGQLEIVREILTADGAGDVDTAAYVGNRANYTVTFSNGGTVVVTDNVGDEGTDILRNIERLQFADQVLINNTSAIGQPSISDMTPTEGSTLTASPGTIADPNGTTTSVFTYQWQAFIAGVWTNIAGATAATFTPTQLQVNQQLRVVATFTDDLGSVESIVSDPTAVVGDLFVGTNAANVFVGTEGADNASGLGGADTLSGNGGDDILNGGAGNDTLNGGAGLDTLIGDAGNDTLNGGAGADAMAGGLGNDTYVVDDVLDVVTEAAGQGTDLVQTTLASYSLGAEVEQLTFTGVGDFTGTGNGLANRIQSGGGNDTLDGGVGIDTMLGGLGNDTYVVDNADDVTTEAAGAGTDTVMASVTDTLQGNVENLVLTGVGNIGGTGNGLANTMTGNTGNNALSGAGGDDVILGGLGADTLTGGAGNDTLDGGEGADVLTGDGGNDTYIGGSGDDMLIGGAGNDTFVFATGFGNDMITTFDSNPAGGQDLLDISGTGINALTFAAGVTIGSSGGSALITIGSDTITLIGVAEATITQADFLLA
jgi:Ca2+-binding RTX toxin-like protein